MRLLPFLKPTKGVQIAGGGSYTLPPATDTTLGGVKIGSGVNVTSDGTISVNGGGSYTLPPATSETLGGIKVGSRLSVESDGTLSASDQSTPIATTSMAGKVIPDGSSITVDSSGVISTSSSGLSNWTSGAITLTTSTSGATNQGATYCLSDNLLLIYLNGFETIAGTRVTYEYPSTLPIAITLSNYVEPQNLIFSYTTTGRAVGNSNSREISVYMNGSGTVSGIFGTIVIPINPS